MSNSAQFSIVCIGCSKGGISTLPHILTPLPADYALPIVIIQHLKEGTGELLVQLLDQQCDLNVVEAQQLDTLEKGSVYTAPADYHLYIDREKRFSLSVDDKVAYSRPSIDVFFDSAAHAFHSNVIAILLTGANRDGTEGMMTVKRFGGVTIAQKPESADAGEMPRAAIAKGVVDYIMTPEEISYFLLNIYT